MNVFRRLLESATGFFAPVVKRFDSCGVVILVSLLAVAVSANANPPEKLTFYGAGHPFIQYTGRIDFSNPQLPRFWQPGVYFRFRFSGNDCQLIINDEMLWGTNHNYLELVVDDKPYRIQTKSRTDTISLAAYLDGPAEHEVTVMKNTEANIGYIELAGILCSEMLKPSARHQRKIECIGNSITCGTGSDLSAVPCGGGKWHDQHNAWQSYGAVAARKLKADFHLSSVSGIGLMKSCCNMTVTMPQVFDKVSMRNDTIAWDFSKFQPDVVTVCLGQNDGIQDSAVFCQNYISFLSRLRSYYPKAKLLLLSSPMADATLRAFMQKTLLPVVAYVNAKGDANVYTCIFKNQYSSGCDFHPTIAEHAIIAGEVASRIQEITGWD